ncbi:hypothetical protein BDN72DRAFT_842189 [Pluteus cervinus]|uniref:Uncharacterized protein n=1 Tax=Pluteus cervinus TaxID=181527 RepID=A0ACD3ATC2_9AGAR|nr:hypothetical protein BDN72DRAFT_842189 [Pluteus cervinus]
MITPITQKKTTGSVELLVNLPNELILEIIEDIEEETLLVLSMVCHRLHLLIIPIILSRYNLLECISQGVLKLDTGNGPVLSALHIATFVTYLKTLDMTLQYMCNFPARLRRLQGFLSKRVDRLENEQEWYSSIAEFLNSAVRLPGSKLSIIGGSGWKTQGKAHVHVVMEDVMEEKKIEKDASSEIVGRTHNSAPLVVRSGS